MPLRTFSAALARSCALVLLAFGAVGCSTTLSFDDECTTHTDCDTIAAGLLCAPEKVCVACTGDEQCAARGEGLVCTDGACQAPSEPPGPKAPAREDLLTGTCTRILGLPDDEEIPDDAIVLASILPKSGALADFGVHFEQGVELAVTEINQIGGLVGRKLAVVACDSATDAAVGEEAARHVTTVGKVPAIIGPGSSRVSIEVFNSVVHTAGVLQMSASATSPALTDLFDDGLLWRTVPSDALQGRAIAEMLIDLEFEKVAVVNREDAYGTGLADAIVERFCATQDCSPERMQVRSYNSNAPEEDLTSISVELIEFKPDVLVLVAFFDEGIGFMNTMADAGVSQLILTDGTRSELLSTELKSTEALCKAVGTKPSTPDSAEFQAFSIRYNRKYASAPGTFAAHHYDAVYVLGLAMAAALAHGDELTGATVSEGLKRLSAGDPISAGTSDWNRATQTLRNNAEASIDYIGVSGPLDFDPEKGEAPADVEAWRALPTTGELGSLGVILDAAGTYTAPEGLKQNPDKECGRYPIAGGEDPVAATETPRSDLLKTTCTRILGIPDTETITTDTILIASIQPKSGALEGFGVHFEQGIELAVTEINEVGGLLGDKIGVIACDSGTDNDIAKAAAQHVAVDVGVPAIIGPGGSGVNIAVFNDVVHAAGAVQMTGSATSPALTDLPDDDLLWRTVPSDALQGAAISDMLVALDFQKVAVVNRADAYGDGLADAIFQRYCTEVDCTADSFLSFSYNADAPDDDLSGIIDELRDFQPDAVVVIAFYAEGIGFMNSMISEGVTQFVLTDGTRSDKLLGELNGAEAQCKAIGTQPAAPEGDEFSSFAVRYVRKFSDDPGTFAANHYDAMYLLGYAMAAAKAQGDVLSGATLAAGLKRLSAGDEITAGTSKWNQAIQLLSSNPESTIDYTGASGPLDFDNEKGEASASIEGWRLRPTDSDIGSMGVVFGPDGSFVAPDDLEHNLDAACTDFPITSGGD